MARSRPLLLPCLLLWLAVIAPTVAEAGDLRGEWRALDSPGAEWTPFQPGQLNRIPRQPAGAELRLWPADGHWSDDADWLVIRRPALERFVWLPPDGGAPVSAAVLEVDRHGWFGHGRIGFELPAELADDQPLRLRLEPQPSLNGNIAFALQSRDLFYRDDSGWLALASTCLSMLGGMAVIALVFALRLRDRAFFYYAGYLIGYLGIQLIQTGYVASPLGWTWVAEYSRAWGRGFVVLSVVSAAMFLGRFALIGHAPRSRRLLHGYAAAIAINAALSWWPWEPLQALARSLLNPLLIVGGPLLLALALHAWWRGSRYAGFFVIGWTPLLLITVADSAQLYGLFGHWLWSNEAALVAAAFEAVVLSAGLADRTASIRREHELARDRAEHDPLTGVLNRGALTESLSSMLADPRAEPIAVLFCDLDHFKALNDRAGHARGDAALQRVAAELSASLRDSDRVGRYGGEEFVLLLPRTRSRAATEIAERIRRRIAALDGLGVTISIGVAEGHCGEPVDELLGRADRALYAAKDRGRNRVVAAEA